MEEFLKPFYSWILILLLITGAFTHGCGFLAEKGQEPRGDTNLPVSGVGKFLKQDVYCSAEFIQPYVVEDPTGSAWSSAEPCVIADGGSIRLWFERRSNSNDNSTIHTALLAVGQGTACREVNAGLIEPVQEIVLDPDPGRPAGAPSVLKVGGRYRMWFELGTRAAIALAETESCTPGDCASWTLVDDRILEPNQAWEKDSVGSPTVVLHNGLYRMWYDGDSNGDRSIGYAWSYDGLNWIKTDAAGTEDSAVGGLNGTVMPVLRATQTNWEFWYPDPASPRYIGRVGTPSVIVYQSPLRTLFLMYYTGNLEGRLRPPPRSPPSPGMDSSIGIAASQDGLNWQKAPSYSQPDVIASEINPIMAEKLPVSIPIPDKPKGSVNVFNPIFIVHEAAPSVLEVVPNQFFIMLWHQTAWANLYLPESPFPGGSGIGFAYTGNPPF